MGGVQQSVKCVCVIVGGVHGCSPGATRPAAGSLVAPADGTWRLQYKNAAIGCNNCLMNIHAKII